MNESIPWAGREEVTPAGERAAFDFIIQFIHSHCGIRLHSGKEALIRARLGRRMRHHGFTRLEDYCRFLRNAGDSEMRQVVDALTTNYTSFMREQDHFEFLVREALPAFARERGREFSFWSAACSSGEEPYTIAIYLSEYFAQGGGARWKIVGSDISGKVLQSARAGIYSADRVQPVPMDWLRKYFQKGMGSSSGYFRVKESLAARVSFQQINLLETWQHTARFDVIFCRNVMIYFDRDTQGQIGRRLCEHLAPGGYLIIGHSESLSGLNLPVRCLRPSIYRKETT